MSFGRRQKGWMRSVTPTEWFFISKTGSGNRVQFSIRTEALFPSNSSAMHPYPAPCHCAAPGFSLGCNLDVGCWKQKLQKRPRVMFMRVLTMVHSFTYFLITHPSTSRWSFVSVNTDAHSCAHTHISFLCLFLPKSYCTSMKAVKPPTSLPACWNFPDDSPE